MILILLISSISLSCCVGQMDPTEYLLVTRPERDSDLSNEFFSNHSAWAWRAHQTPWGMNVPYDLFLNEVLPYAAFTEPRHWGWRQIFWDYLIPKLEAEGVETLLEAIFAVNRHIWNITQPPITFIAAPSDEINNYCVEEFMMGEYTEGTPGGSCTSTAIFFVMACRSVGIPSRVAGVPHWNLGPTACPHGDADDRCGDHNWPEIWTGDGWHYIARGSTKLDSDWFTQQAKNQVQGSQNHSIYATSWTKPGSSLAPDMKYYPNSIPSVVGRFPMVWHWKGESQFEVSDVYAWDVTCRYRDC